MLGKQIFDDPKISKDESMSCSSCHIERLYFQDGYSRALARTRQLKRNTPTLLNLQFYDSFFWDGRATTLKEQIKEPLLTHLEIGATQESLETYIFKNRVLSELYDNSKNTSSIDFITELIEIYLLSFPKENLSELNTRLQNMPGWDVFNEQGCSSCHVPPTLTDNRFHNIGLLKRKTILERTQGKNSGFRLGFDYGRGNVVGGTNNLYAYRTPSLWHVPNTAPYMHDGRFDSLEEVINFYSDKGTPSS
jgi:cytochrome c peroxidase